MALGNCSWLPKRKLAGKPGFKLPVHETPPARPPSTQKEEVCASIDHQNVSETALLPHGLDWTVGQSERSWTMVMWRLFFFFLVLKDQDQSILPSTSQTLVWQNEFSTLEILVRITLWYRDLALSRYSVSIQRIRPPKHPRIRPHFLNLYCVWAPISGC